MPTSLKKNIFIQYPSVRRVFEDKVPKIIPEAPFWKQFLESYTKNDFLSKGKEILEPDMFAEYERKEEKYYIEEEMFYDKNWNLLYDDLLEEPHGIRKDESTAPDKFDMYGPYIKMINRCSSNIVKSLPIQNLDELEQDEGELIKLQIPDKKKYIEGHMGSTYKEEISNAKNISAFEDELFSFDGTMDVKISNEVAVKIANEINQSRNSNHMESFDNIPEDFKLNFTQTFILLNEALFYKYHLKEDLANVNELIKLYYDRMIYLKENYRNLTSIIQPTLHCIEKVMESKSSNHFNPEVSPIHFQFDIVKRKSEEVSQEGAKRVKKTLFN